MTRTVGAGDREEYEGRRTEPVGELDLVTVEAIRPGDLVELPRGGPRKVLRVEGPYGDGSRVVVYEAFGEDAYGKNPGRPNGYIREARRVERGLRPLAPGDRWPVAREVGGVTSSCGEAASSLPALPPPEASGRGS